MDYIDKLVLAHVLAAPAVAGVLGAVASNADRIIKFALKYFSKDQIDSAVDKVAANVKARVDKDAQNP